MARVAAFVGRALLWAVVAFAAWSAAAKPVSLACGWIGARLVALVAPVDGVRHDYREGEVILRVVPDYATARRHNLAAGASIEAAVSPLTYAYGLPFFLALMLASRPRGLAWKVLAGFGVIALFAGAGVGFDALVQMMNATAAPGGEPLLSFTRPARELVALGYQLASLILPPLVPPLLWMALDWRAVLALAGRHE